MVGLSSNFYIGLVLVGDWLVVAGGWFSRLTLGAGCWLSSTFFFVCDGVW